MGKKIKDTQLMAIMILTLYFLTQSNAATVNPRFVLGEQPRRFPLNQCHDGQDMITFAEFHPGQRVIVLPRDQYQSYDCFALETVEQYMRLHGRFFEHPLLRTRYTVEDLQYHMFILD